MKLGKANLALAIAGLIGVLAMAGSRALAQFAGGPALPIVLPQEADQSAQAIYTRKCGICHAPGGMGQIQLARRLGPAAAMAPVPPKETVLTERDDLSADMILTVVRSGMGAMPAIPKGDVSDQQLSAIASYLTNKEGKKP